MTRTIATLARKYGALITTASLVVVLAIAVQGGFQTRDEISATFARLAEIQRAQVSLEELERRQIDEENSVRGLEQTKDDFYRAQYAAAAGSFDSVFGDVRVALQHERLSGALSALDEYDAIHRQWRAKIAETILAHPSDDPRRFNKLNKVLTDYAERDASNVREALNQTGDALSRNTLYQVNENTLIRSFWLVVLGLIAVVANGYRSRASRELAEERVITETLQRAFRSEHVPLPHCEIGSAYMAAASGLAVGGDVFDVYRLSDHLALVLIADVSGKGVDAAVLTAFIKFTMRGIALRRRDPGAMLAEFNTAFAQTVENPHLFVSMVAGVLDTNTRQFRYASAGHDSAWIRRSVEVQQLQVTGPVLGVMEEPFDTKVVFLEEGDTIVLATDGLSEARTRSGEQLGERGAAAMIASSSREPQRFADEIVAKVHQLENKTRDDLAVLAIRVVRDASGA